MPGWHYAGFWVRFLAFLLDGIVLGILTAALLPFSGPQFTTGPGLQRFTVHATRERARAPSSGSSTSSASGPGAGRPSG